MPGPHISRRDPLKQGHRTPQEFLTVVEQRFGPIGFDLAASCGHQVSKNYFSPKEDALQQDWSQVKVQKGQVVWLNPPFANIRPWVKKLNDECSKLPRWTLCLVPYSAGSHWWHDHVMGKCFALGVPRMKFQGSTQPFPKDLALCCYGFGVHGYGFWNWKLGPES